jgi:aryl-alcohol dehydrogenase-like predicted oxidoreductase
MTPTISGMATSEGTRRLADRFATRFVPDFYRPVTSGFTVASLGMGTYLGECDDAEDERYVEVLTSGIAQGLNLVDTAINYRCQRSERATGRAIQLAVAAGTARDELVVCTKAGYVPLEGAPPASRDEYEHYLDAEYFEPGLIDRKDLVAGGHCLHPKFLANQVERSRTNLGLDCIDVIYLHNPEQQLDTVSRRDFTSVMRDAFAEMETQVSAGRVGSYGLATWNGFRVFAAARNHLSLTELLAIAREVGGVDHHLRTVQLPVNLAMTEAVRAPTQSRNDRNISLLDAAEEEGVSVVASASLMQAQLTQNLPAQVKSMFPNASTDAQRAISFVRSLPVASALVGMRSSAHLAENLAAMAAVSRA